MSRRTIFTPLALAVMCGSAAAQAGLVASPQRVAIPEGASLGQTTLTWSTSRRSTQLWVAHGARGEKLMSSAGSAGRATARWIQRGDPYTFRLYAVDGVRTLLAEVEVRALTLPRPGLGQNAFHLLRQYLGTASGGRREPDRYRRVTLAMARKALADARALGTDYLRISLPGWHASDLDTWLADPAAYWDTVETLFDDLDAHGLQIIPVLMWHVPQFPERFGGSTRDLITDAGSASRRELWRHTREFITRFKGRRTIKFYELTNELNLDADLDLERRHPGDPSYGRFSTDEMIAFMAEFAGLVRREDSSRLISSGYSIPRSCAAHLRRSPEWRGPDWRADTLAEFEDYVGDTNGPVDIVSVHLYNSGKHVRFGASGDFNGELLGHVKAACDRLGKPLYLGEFGDVKPHVDVAPSAPYTSDLLRRIATLGVPYASPWIFEFYQFATDRPDAFNLEPGVTDLVLARMQDANRALGNHPPARPPADLTPPKVVLTWPLDGDVLVRSAETLYAVASDDGGGAARVEFLVDGALLSASPVAPFTATLDARALSAGRHVVTARAFDAAGNSNDFETVVWTPWVRATPERVVVPVGRSTGPTEISWNAGQQSAQLWVSRNGASEVRVSGNARGRVTVSWISAGSSYAFRLRRAGSGALLAEIGVQGVR